MKASDLGITQFAKADPIVSIEGCAVMVTDAVLVDTKFGERILVSVTVLEDLTRHRVFMTPYKSREALLKHFEGSNERIGPVAIVKASTAKPGQKPAWTFVDVEADADDLGPGVTAKEHQDEIPF